MSASSHGYAGLTSGLLDTAPPELLDTPLDRLAPEGADEAALELLRAAFEDGEASTLRELLGEGRLERLLDTRCTAREEQRLCAQLARWGSHEPSPHDDAERLVELPEPPGDPEGLTRWADAHGLAEALHAARHGHEAPTARPARADTTAPPRHASLLGELDPERDLRLRLWREARAEVAERARRARWARPPAAELARLAERLRGRCPDGAAALAGVRFSVSHPVSLDGASGRVTAQLYGRHGHAQLALHLSGYEQRALDATCSCGAADCAHAAALAARLLEACLGPDDRLHAALCTFCRVPSWQRFVAALRGDDARDARSQRVTFRLARGDAHTLTLAAFAGPHDGRPDKARLASPKQLLRTRPAPEDVPVLEAMVGRMRGATAQTVGVDLALLRSLVEHPRLTLEGHGHALSVVEERVEVTLAELPEGILPGLSLAGTPLAGQALADRRFVWLLDPAIGRLTFAELTPALCRWSAALSQFRGVLPKESYASLAPLIAGMRHVAHVETPRTLLGHERPAPRTLTLNLSRAATEGLYVTLSMTPLPLGAPWPPGRGPELVHGLVDGVETHTRRDLAWEREASARLEVALGLTQGLRTGPSSYHVADEQAALALLECAAQHHAELELCWAEPARALVSKGVLRPQQLSIRLFKKGDWFGLSGKQRGAGGGADLPLASLFEAVRRGERFVKISGDGYAEIAEELRERLLRVEPMVRPAPSELSLAPSALPQLVEALSGEDVELDASARALVAAQAEPAHDDFSLPATLVPRDYQRAGIAFLLQRSRWATGVCLADEMGLGKTVQCIGLLWLRRGLGPQLVVAPTSVVGNWCDELARFAPDLPVIPYMGDARKGRLDTLAPGSVLVTSYDVLLRDQGALAPHSFATLVVDEAQFVKNARTERFRAVAAVSADFRVALSGTPVENRIGDLFSLFSLLAPGLLGAWPRFRARFAVPIERYEDRDRAELLRSLVAPFILRREKREVARELPERTEVVHRVELSAPERDLYDAAARAAREALDLRGRNPRIPRLKVLAELTRLRQLACHPRLVLSADLTASSKLRALLGLLDDLLPRGHRVLLFSQFTRHLDLVREALDARGIPSLSLIGETPAHERKQAVDTFQRGDVPVFLISLRAGGAGLNLTAADYVVHLDPWWNPAAEDQASDRAHRIGQLRPVTVVKLVSEDTIEEKVLGLHAHKRRLFAQLFEEGGGGDAELGGSELYEELFGG